MFLKTSNCKTNYEAFSSEMVGTTPKNVDVHFLKGIGAAGQRVASQCLTAMMISVHSLFVWVISGH